MVIKSGVDYSHQVASCMHFPANHMVINLFFVLSCSFSPVDLIFSAEACVYKNKGIYFKLDLTLHPFWISLHWNNKDLCCEGRV